MFFCFFNQKMWLRHLGYRFSGEGFAGKGLEEFDVVAGGGFLVAGVVNNRVVAQQNARPACLNRALAGEIPQLDLFSRIA